MAAIGGSAAVMELIADGRYEQVGTFNGNPLALAATRPLGEILTPAAYERMGRLAGAAAGQFGRDDRRTRLRLARGERRRQGLCDVQA